MTNIEAMISQYIKKGYSELLAESKVCQDIILKAISKSTFSNHVTIKGGVVMQNITNDIRRATRDIDFDFIRYPIDEKSIKHFFDRINCIEGIDISLASKIEELSQQEYRGKRVWVSIEDKAGNSIKTKLDIGVHKNIQIKQEEYCFNIFQDEDRVCLLINSKEQIFTEKLRALLKFGVFSGRIKDVFDMYYLLNNIDYNKLKRCIGTYIIDDLDMIENNMDDIIRRVNKIFSNPSFIKNVEKDNKSNWIDASPENVFESIIAFLNKLK